jgi:cytoskeletal protein RodZ
VSRWKPARHKKKTEETGSTGRLLSCAFIIGVGLLLLYVLFAALLK